MKPQELIKSIVAAISPLIDARIRTAEVTIKAHTDAAIKASEERLTKRIDAVEHKLDTIVQDHEARLAIIEDNSRLPSN